MSLSFCFLILDVLLTLFLFMACVFVLGFGIGYFALNIFSLVGGQFVHVFFYCAIGRWSLGFLLQLQRALTKTFPKSTFAPRLLILGRFPLRGEAFNNNCYSRADVCRDLLALPFGIKILRFWLFYVSLRPSVLRACWL